MDVMRITMEAEGFAKQHFCVTWSEELGQFVGIWTAHTECTVRGDTLGEVIDRIYESDAMGEELKMPAFSQHEFAGAPGD